MQVIDVLVRTSGGTLLLALGLLLIREAPRERVAWLTLLLALGVCGFLARNTPDESLKLAGSAAVVAGLLSGNAALFVWWFSLAVFDDEFRLDRVKQAVGVAWFTTALLDRGVFGERYADVGLTWLLLAMGAGMVGHLAYRLLRDLEGDLVEPRRRARRRLVAALAVLLLVDLAVDLILGFAWKPRWFTIAQNGAILALAVQMMLWLTRADAGALTFRRDAAVGSSGAGAAVPPAEPAASPPDARLLVRLRMLMETDRLYRDPDLTFAAFVARMGAPEPEVRRLVNQQLGHRHFRSFLNAYRVADAREALADPARSQEKIVGVALDAGFASLASFNRAFKTIEGRSPTEFRAEQLSIRAAADEARENRDPSRPDSRAQRVLRNDRP